MACSSLALRVTLAIAFVALSCGYGEQPNGHSEPVGGKAKDKTAVVSTISSRVPVDVTEVTTLTSEEEDEDEENDLEHTVAEIVSPIEPPPPVPPKESRKQRDKSHVTRDARRNLKKSG